MLIPIWLLPILGLLILAILLGMVINYFVHKAEERLDSALLFHPSIAILSALLFFFIPPPYFSHLTSLQRNAIFFFVTSVLTVGVIQLVFFTRGTVTQFLSFVSPRFSALQQKLAGKSFFIFIYEKIVAFLSPRMTRPFYKGFPEFLGSCVAIAFLGAYVVGVFIIIVSQLSYFFWYFN